MTRNRWLLIALSLTVIAAAIAGLWAMKTVTLVIAGRPFRMTTFALTVEGLLRQARVSVGPADQLQPAAEDTLSEGLVVTLTRASQVQILVDGRTTTLLTTERLPVRLLANAGVTLSPGDVILSSGSAIDPIQPLPQTETTILRVRRAVPITLQIDGQTRNLTSSAFTVGQALWEAGVTVNLADQITPTLDTPLSAPLTVTLRSSRPLTVQLGDRIMSVRTTADTVGAALAEVGLSLQGLDYSMPSESAHLPADGSIRVIRAQEQVILDERPLPFETAFQLDPEMPIDQRGVSDPGAYGLATGRTRVRYEDGEEVSRQVEGEWVALEPRPRVMGYGTKIEIRSLDTSLGPLEYWRAVPMYATSYSPCRIFTDRCDSVTSSGATLQKGVAAVTLRHYRSMAGARVYVPGYGIATILDVGGGIPGRNWIDLGYSEADYVSWHQWVTVYFLTPVPPEGLILYELN